MAYVNTPPKADVLEDVMERITALAVVLDMEDGVRLSHIREGLSKFNREQLSALWWMLDSDSRRP